MRALKQHLLTLPGVRPAWEQYHCAQLERQYENRREHYARLAAERKLVYREDEVAAAVRSRLAKRGYSPVRRKIGEIHTFAFVPNISWHSHLLPDLMQMGPVSVFDYMMLGFNIETLRRPSTTRVP